jgi:hypothetical protein
METYKVTNKTTGEERTGMTINGAIDLYDSLGGAAKGWAVEKEEAIKTEREFIKEIKTFVHESILATDTLIGTMTVSKSGKAYLHYNYAFENTDCDYDDAVSEIADMAFEYCQKKKYKLMMY